MIRTDLNIPFEFKTGTVLIDNQTRRKSNWINKTITTMKLEAIEYDSNYHDLILLVSDESKYPFDLHVFLDRNETKSVWAHSLMDFETLIVEVNKAVNKTTSRDLDGVHFDYTHRIVFEVDKVKETVKFQYMYVDNVRAEYEFKYRSMSLKSYSMDSKPTGLAKVFIDVFYNGNVHDEYGSPVRRINYHYVEPEKESLELSEKEIEDILTKDVQVKPEKSDTEKTLDAIWEMFKINLLNNKIITEQEYEVFKRAISFFVKK